MVRRRKMTWMLAVAMDFRAALGTSHRACVAEPCSEDTSHHTALLALAPIHTTLGRAAFTVDMVHTILDLSTPTAPGAVQQSVAVGEPTAGA